MQRIKNTYKFQKKRSISHAQKSYIALRFPTENVYLSNANTANVEGSDSASDQICTRHTKRLEEIHKLTRSLRYVFSRCVGGKFVCCRFSKYKKFAI